MSKTFQAPVAHRPAVFTGGPTPDIQFFEDQLSNPETHAELGALPRFSTKKAPK